MNFLQRQISREPSSGVVSSGVVSIRNSVTELERCQQNLEITLECYRALTADLGRFTIQLEDETTDPLRRQLGAIADEVKNGSPRDLPAYGSKLRALLHEHAQKVTEYIAEIQVDRAQTEQALHELAASLTHSDADHDGRIRTTVDNLRSLARSPGARSVGDILRNAANSIEQSVEQIRRQHQVTIAQFHNEIRALQKRIDPELSEDGTGSHTRVFNRLEIQERILTATPGEFQLVLVRVRGLRLADVQFGPDVSAQLASAFVVRLRNTLPYSTVIARWGEEEFIGLISGPPSGVPSSSFSKSIGENLHGGYACVHDGKNVRPSIDVTVCVVDSTSRDTPQQILDRTETSLLRI